MNALPKANILIAIKDCFMKYVTFEGRARRSEYWFFMLLINSMTVILLIFLILCLCGIMGVVRKNYNENEPNYNPYYSYYYSDTGMWAMIGVFITYVCGITLPTLSATVRRLHDIGKPGATIFIGLLPFIGGIALLSILCFDSEKEPNEYGPSPKYTKILANDEIYENEISPVIN